MTSQNQPASNDARGHSAPLGFAVPNSLKLLTETLEKFETFKREQGERLKACKEMITRLHKRVETTDLENRRLKAQVLSLQSDNSRLANENAVYLRTQQTMDTAIHLACATSHETMQFISDATRMTMPSMPTSLGAEEPVIRQPQAQPELALVRKQPMATFQAAAEHEADGDLAPLELVKPLPPSIQPEAPAAVADLSSIDSIEAMSNEIDAMIALEFREGFTLDDPATEASAEEANEESKAA
ncbi:hypothetical protein OIU34_24660 [Pararhizobium sp. BT-229]|uniref:hypothetical protein n=1 Tax=Pararhizobium sp. BT-229 TaxID=2986923 RepID=UPI0021F6E918|nr:hypothetical protein [Pararhizobium sp. BT-229]MCV9965094.1 hypothetical protein [Pararhizobium sp. BT-229]